MAARGAAGVEVEFEERGIPIADLTVEP